MKWVEKALEVAAEEFREACKEHVYDLNMHVAAIAYKELPKEDLEIFMDEFVRTLKYRNLRVWTKPTGDETVFVTPIRVSGYTLAMAMDNLKKVLVRTNEVMQLYSICLEPNDDKVLIRLYKVTNGFV